VADPVSWFVVEKGWQVVGSDATELGTVDEVIGDSDADIFNGLAVSPGLLGRSRYVPAERVREIVEGRIVLDLDKDSFAQLAAHEQPPPSERVRSDTTDL
jgi:sporulation protein YlmC with PRC-barrel domain